MGLTYSNRSNARRAAVHTGLRGDQVEITVHKQAGEVRFGWREIARQVAPTEKQANPIALANPSIFNSCKRPKDGTKCSHIWEWLDKNPSSQIKDVKAAGVAFGWNVNTVNRQFYLYKAAHFEGA